MNNSGAKELRLLTYLLQPSFSTPTSSLTPRVLLNFPKETNSEH